MSDLYTYIQDGKIIEGPRPLPKSWGNISGLHLLGKTAEGRDRLKLLGWLPYEDVKPPFDPKAQSLAHDGYEVKGDKVISNYLVTDRDLEKEKADRVKALLEEKARIEALLKYDGGEIPKELL